MLKLRKFKVIEAFSGIGSQAKAIEKAGLDHWKILNTIEWDINAIIAYYFIHFNGSNLSRYKFMDEDEIDRIIDKYPLSMDGKSQMTVSQRKRISNEIKWRLAAAIENTSNLGSIASLKGEDLNDDIDLLTYSFPCQDLSIAGVWHGLNTGISKDVSNRSGMLWEVERLLVNKFENERKLPTFLLMENVSNILSHRHKSDFEMWQKNLEKMGYRNKVYKLNAANFGIPQNRERVFMVSVQIGQNSRIAPVIEEILENNSFIYNSDDAVFQKPVKPIKEFLRMNYSVEKYKLEADESQPNDTPSRRRIWFDNIKIFDSEGRYTDRLIPTITTKQDRNPNSGVIYYNDSSNSNKANFRYLTPRECFLLMGFEERDYEALIANNFRVGERGLFFTQAKLIKMAGNSIVVDVLVEIFKLIEEMNIIIIQDSELGIKAINVG